MVSILISALTTGYTSAMLSFDFDIDVERMKNQPKFYGESASEVERTILLNLLRMLPVECR